MADRAELIERLEDECERLRKVAHEAGPAGTLRTNHNGHRWLDNQNTAWADRSREWCRAMDRLDALRSLEAKEGER